MKKLVFLTLLSVFLLSCQIEQEINLEKDGSGRYTLGFDMSEILKTRGNGLSPTGDTPKRNIDTIIKFSDFLDKHKDSIKKLSKEEREKLKSLEDFDLRLKIDTSSTSPKMKMKLGFNFQDLKELKTIEDKLKNQKVKDLDMFKKTGEKGGSPLAIIKSFNTSFSSKRFSYKISEEALKEAEKDKDTTMNDNMFAQMIRFKQIIRFPHKIKSISNKNVKILSDFKSIEQEVNFFEIHSNPKIFDIDVEFE